MNNDEQKREIEAAKFRGEIEELARRADGGCQRSLNRLRTLIRDYPGYFKQTDKKKTK